MSLRAHNQEHNQRLFIVEGNIGAGKSTFLKIIQKHLNTQVVFEPLDKWQKVGGTQNLLEKFYVDGPRWAYTFQTYAFVSRIVAQQESARVNQHSTQVLERSVFSDRYCFAKNCFESGMMTALEWKLYQEWFTWLVEQYMQQPAGFIYLQTDPETCFKRLQHRARQEEAIVPFDYLAKLHDKHERWLIAKEGIISSLQDVPVLIVPCNQEFEGDEQQQAEHMQAVWQFINQYGGSVTLKNKSLQGALQI